MRTSLTALAQAKKNRFNAGPLDHDASANGRREATSTPVLYWSAVLISENPQCKNFDQIHFCFKRDSIYVASSQAAATEAAAEAGTQSDDPRTNDSFQIKW